MRKYEDEGAFWYVSWWAMAEKGGLRGASLLAAVRVANRAAILTGLRRANSIPPEIGLAILRSYRYDLRLVREVIARADLDSRIVSQALSSYLLIQELVARPDLPPWALFDVARLADRAMLGLVVERIVAHPNIDEAIVTAMFERLGVDSLSREALLKVPTVPPGVQRAIVDGGDDSLKAELILHPSVAESLIGPLLDALLKCDCGRAISVAVSFHGLPTERLRALLFADDHRLAAAAADRIAELDGIRIKDFVRFHSGVRSRALCDFATRHARHGLGLFVAVCHLARDILRGRPGELAALVEAAYASPHAGATYGALLWAGPGKIKAFNDSLSAVPADPLRRLMSEVVRNGGLEGVFSKFPAILARDGAAEVLATIRWRRVRSFDDLQLKVREALDLRVVRRKLLRPFRHAPWLARLDGARLSTGHRVSVPRTKRALLTLGMALDNCMASDETGHADQVADGRAVIFGIRRGRAPVFAVQSSTDGRKILQISGKRNSAAPAPLVGELLALMAVACIPEANGVPFEGQVAIF